MRVFVTGGSGFIGRAVVPELLSHGHEVVGLARSPEAEQKVRALGATAVQGDLTDLAVLAKGAANSDGVIHLAFDHDTAFVRGDFASAAQTDRAVLETFGEVLANSDRPLVIAGGVLGLASGRTGTEADVPSPPPGHPMTGRSQNAIFTTSLADRGVRSSVVRLSPTVHGPEDQGFIFWLAEGAQRAGAALYVGSGDQRWPAVHRLDAAVLFRLALEGAPAGSVVHGVAEEGVRTADIAQAIGDQLGLPTKSVTDEEAAVHLGMLGNLLDLDSPASNERTRALLGWIPQQPTLLEDVAAGYYTTR